MSLAGCNTQYWCFYEWVDGDGQYQYTSYWVNDPSWYLVTSRCYDSAQSIVGSTLLSLEDTLDSGGVITRFCVDAWGAMWGENGWNGLDFYVNLKVFRKVGNTLMFIGESGDRHIQTTPRHWVNYGYGWELGFSEGDYIEGLISFDCFIPGCRAGDIIGLYGYGPYDGEWGYVYCTTQSDPNYLRHSGSVTTDTPISQWTNHHSGRWSVSVEIGIPEGVSGFMLFPDDARTPLYNAKLTMTMYHKNDAGDFDYFYEYPPIYSDKHGWFWIKVRDNPFSIWSWEYWEYLLWGWNRVNIKVEMCNGQELCRSGIEFSQDYAFVELTYPVRITHRLIVKDSYTRALLPGVFTVYIDGYNMDSIQMTDSNGLSEWKDAHPLIITNIVSSDIYVGQTLNIDRRFIDVLFACWQETEVLLQPLSLGKEIHFDKPRYHPEETMTITFDTDSIINCSVRLYDAHGYKILEVPLGNQVTVPPPITYTIPAKVFYGLFFARLFDSGSMELANTYAYVGTLGTLNHDISKLCTDKIITIGYDNIDPVFKVGTPPNNMKIEIFDGKKVLLASMWVPNAKGSSNYTVLGTEDIYKAWMVVLTDQWGNMVDADHISVFGCKQTILGRVRRRNGNPVKACVETLDLGFMGFGVTKVFTDVDGRFEIKKIPPFPTTYLESYKGGYKKALTPVSLGEDEIKMVDVTLEGLIKGTITDEENKPMANVYVILEGGGPLSDVVETSQDNGNYDIPVLATGDQNLRVMKNNFNVLEESVNVPEISENAMQQIRDKQLIRRALELFDANFKKTNVAFESSLVQLDQVDIPNIQAGIMELTDSGQKIALIEIATGAGNSIGTGLGGDDLGDVMCEYYGDDENGKPIIRCSYVNRLSI